MSLGKANYIVKGLLAKRLIKVNGFRRDSNRRGYIYLLTGEGISAKAELTRQFLAFKIKEYDALRIEIDRLRTETPDNVRVEARQTWP